MAQQLIELGTPPDGAGGDTIRSANVKCNENFTELYERADKSATSGVNRDITALHGLTVPLSVMQGGTGGKTGEDACNYLGAARSGVNSDITSLTGLSTALSVAQGGTGAQDGEGACRSIGAVALSKKNASHGTLLGNGSMPSIAWIDSDRNELGPLTISNDGNVHASCVLAFHRVGEFACFLGLDTDNQLKVGGWSMGRNAFVIYHQGNTTRAADGTLKAV